MKMHQKIVAEYFKLYVLLNMADRHIFEDYIVDILIAHHKGIGLRLRRKPSDEHLKILAKLLDAKLRSLGIQ